MKRARWLCALMLAASAPVGAAAPPVADAALAAGIAQAREGDFQGALLKLDEAIRRLETEGAPDRELAQGYLYLGISYLELGQEMPALERFRAAVLRDLELRLDAAEFSPQVIRFFEAARQEVAAMRSPAPGPPRPASPASPSPTPAPTPAAQGKGSGRTVLLVVGGAAAVAAAALALRDGADTSTTTTTTPPAARATWTSRLEVAAGLGEVACDGSVVSARATSARGAVDGPGGHRLEGRLVTGAGPGTWRFNLAGIRPGSLRVIAGAVESLAPDAVVFRLEGRAGERVAFGFESP